MSLHDFVHVLQVKHGWKHSTQLGTVVMLDGYSLLNINDNLISFYFISFRLLFILKTA